LDPIDNPEHRPGLNPPPAETNPFPAAETVNTPGDLDPFPDTATPSFADWLARNAFLLIFMVGLLVLAYWRLDLEGIWTIGKVAIGLGLVVFIHELGHFAVAKWCDVYVETFSIGFGPALPGCSFQWGETTYKIALFPLGGYVKMLGEGTEAEEDEDNPRSFKNKTVGQRMAIISAGVIMNALLACICFVITYLHGVEQRPALVDTVDAGSPAWRKGLRSGDTIERIGSEENPYFTDMMFTVMTSRKGRPLDLVYAHYPPSGGREEVATTIEPRRDQDDIRPVIGIAPARELTLMPRRYVKYREQPVAIDSPASHSEPPFEFGDVIVGTTDPEHPDQVTELREDPRNPGSGRKDYFQFLGRMHQLAGRPVTVRVRRESGEVQDLRVPPAYHWVMGARMAMGEITAVRDHSPGQKAGIHLPGQDQNGREVPGDVLREVKVLDVRKGPDGTLTVRRIHWNNKDFDARAEAGKRAVEVREKGGAIRLVHELDPLRLPFELEQWAHKRLPAADVVKLLDQDRDGKLSRKELAAIPEEFLKDVPFDAAGQVSPAEVEALLNRVVLVVERTNPLELETPTHSGKQSVTLHAEWDPRWDGDREASYGPHSPLAVPGLGIAYRVKTVVEKVQPGSPLRVGDVVKDLKIKRYDPKTKKSDWSSWQEMPESDQWWPYADYVLQSDDYTEAKDLLLKVERGGTTEEVEVNAAVDRDWPLDQRGLILLLDVRIQKADDVWGALSLGVERTYRSVYQIYLNLYGILNGRLSVKNLGGPITIATTAYDVAGENFYMFVLFLGMISINLAVINFLPIPVLDGGHMVFLVYEKLRGRPASEPVRVLATYIGLALIASLMLFVIILDVRRLHF
jgi:regulator of sigma E protease